jgi:hypothetical protein
MKHRLLNILTVLALLLCLAVVAVWVRSYLPEQFHLRSHKGRILLIFAAKQHGEWFSPQAWNISTDELVHSIYLHTGGEPGSIRFAFSGFEMALTDRDSGFWFFAVPHWAVALPLAALAGWGWWTRRRRSRRETAGRCLGCGYDLRGSPGRCPECGTAASVSTSE